MGDQRFEQLIASLVFAEHPDAERPSTPDGGADVLVSAQGTRRARVWQVKHYPEDIAWKKCEASLDDAVASYDPAEVVFVFPRNLSKPRRDQFEERLVKRKPTVAVTHWGLQRIQEELANHPEISVRYFGEDRGDVLPGLIRAVQQGGKELEDTRDLVNRAFGLDAFARVSDPSFQYDISFGSTGIKPHLWQDPPFMVIQETRGDRRVSAEAWLRPEAHADARYGFTDDEAGARARLQVREAFAAGESIDLTEGVWLRVENAPIAAKEAIDAARVAGYDHLTSTLSPGASRELTMEVVAAGQVQQWRLSVRAIPPPPGVQLSFGAIEDGLAVFADLDVKEAPKGRLQLHLSMHPVQDPSTNAKAARFLLAFLRADRVTCQAPGLLPNAGLVMSGGSTPRSDSDILASVEAYALMYEALTVIEERVGRIDVPKKITRQELDEVLAAGAMLRTGRGSLSFTELVIDLNHAEVDEFIRKAQGGHPGRFSLPFKLFGKLVPAGIAEFNTPPVRLVTKERSDEPGKTRVRLRTDPTVIPFRFVDAEVATTRPSKLWTPGRGPSGLVPGL